MEDDRSTVLDEEDGPNGAVAMHPLGARYTAADDAALIEAVREWHADAAAVLRARSCGRLCCWDTVAALAGRRTGSRRSAGSASSRFQDLMQRGTPAPPGYLTLAQARALSRSDRLAAAAPAAAPPRRRAEAPAAAAAAAAAAPRGGAEAAPRPPPEHRPAAAAPRAAAGAAAPRAAAQAAPKAAAKAAARAAPKAAAKAARPAPRAAPPARASSSKARKRGRREVEEEEEEEEEEGEEGGEEEVGEEGEEGGEGEADSCGQGAGRRGVPWGDAEVAHLESLLVRFPVLGPPHGSLPQMLFWNKVSSCLAAGADGSGLRAARTASAVYQRAKKLQRIARR
jgi:hypothetical protein